ncbi:MAG: hypothetical protein A2096_03010 [Spirochaetes bacterium GWF1_41_5]|nr:MAG: hypothetical protein A2096_03010 [Spirochaetes bacterium GWF1_41_5]HBE03220.1 hypothetical protein [Spirochaetia bacterium]
MKVHTYRFSVDDNILFLKDLHKSDYNSIFEQPYLSFWKKMHDTYNTKIQFNIHGTIDGFTLENLSAKYKPEWIQNSDWIRLVFHQWEEPDRHFSNAEMNPEKIKTDYKRVTSQIIRFAGEKLTSPYITVHGASGGKEVCAALKECGVKGLGAGTWKLPGGEYNMSYYLSQGQINELGKTGMLFDTETGLYFFSFDVILHRKSFSAEKLIFIIKQIFKNTHHWPHLEITFEEWAFTPFHRGFLSDAMKRAELVLKFLCKNNSKAVFLEDIL